MTPTNFKRALALVTVLACFAATGCSAFDSCSNMPDGPGCIDGHEIRDSVDQTRKDNREATEKANDEALKQLCAAAREAGADDACAE